MKKDKAVSKKVDLGISDKQRSAVAGGLAKLLADSYTLYLKTHNFHWNVEGPMFNTLHVMFMDQYTELWNALDLIAERIRALGEYAPGSYKEFSKLTSISESDKVPKAEKMISELLEGHHIVIQTARSLYPLAESCNDEVTLDLLTQRMQVHEKTAWMLRSLLS
ncbi:MAG: DNA starvation/stationary phase protection protein [Bdellovibrio sp.]|nr:DNA starvation/stationary phase protection protein [Bdellovibrio sp.]